MFGVWFIALFLNVVVRGSEICYSRFGCFTNDPPWGGTLQRPVLNLPESPEVVNTTFFLYTRENPTHSQVISALHPSTIRVSNFRTKRITCFIIHGYAPGYRYHHIVEMCKLLLIKEDINCIVINWEGGSNNSYTTAVQNVRIVGAELAYFLDYLETTYGYPPSNVHIIGHSLGAHAGGEAGRRKRGLGRITGLDPAGPLFHDTPPEVRLDPSDAKFVDVIHTNMGRPLFGYEGIIQPCGHLDFYPNGGKTMPGCKGHLLCKRCDINEVMREILSSKSLQCSHWRSFQYYNHSIFIPDGFLGFQCNTYDNFISGKCFPCPKEGCPMMGHYADCFSDVHQDVHQGYYLNTGAFPPFASWRKHISVKLIGMQKMRGIIVVALIGSNKLRREYPITNGLLYPRHTFARFADVDILGDITAVEFKWIKHPIWKGIAFVGAQEVTILNGGNGHKTHFCGIKAVQPEVWQKLTPC
ncbi:pancreatic lipase-related protein 2-like [Elgaria multicarinata webbii]|uniref:pancreatic lipase-related protein 2-like n=1 Tax=Elgaria multicarinata webbii TaxID=159646 RepID=UPI002FCD19DC